MWKSTIKNRISHRERKQPRIAGRPASKKRKGLAKIKHPPAPSLPPRFAALSCFSHSFVGRESEEWLMSVESAGLERKVEMSCAAVVARGASFLCKVSLSVVSVVFPTPRQHTVLCRCARCVIADSDSIGIPCPLNQTCGVSNGYDERRESKKEV